MTIKFANNISTTLALGAGIAATSFDVASTTGFPTLGVGDYFYGTLSNTLGAIEIVQVTSWTGVTVTCTRGAEGTPPAAWSTGDSFEIRITAAGLTTVLNATEVVEEVQTATSGQTVFTLTTFMYVPGENTLSVYVDGVNQIVDLSYTETGTTTVTFISGLHLGALVKFTTLRTSGLTTSAAVVTYEPAGAGAVATTVQAKLRESVSVLDFGAVGDGVTDDTASIQAAIDYAGTLAQPTEVIVPSGKTFILNVAVRTGIAAGVAGLVMRDYVTLVINGTLKAKANIYGPGTLSALIKSPDVGNIGVTIKGSGTIDGNVATQTPSVQCDNIYLVAIYQVKVQDIKCVNANGNGILITKVSGGANHVDTAVINTMVNNCTSIGIQVSHSAANLIISGNQVTTCTNNCIDVYHENGTVAPDPGIISIVGNTVSGGLVGIFPETTANCSVIGNSIGDCVYAGISTNRVNGAPGNLVISGNSVSGPPTGIIGSGDTNGVLICDNTLAGFTVAGIELQGTTVSSYVVHGNMFGPATTTTPIIRLNGTTFVWNQVFDNVCVDPSHDNSKGIVLFAGTIAGTNTLEPIIYSSVARPVKSAGTGASASGGSTGITVPASSAGKLIIKSSAGGAWNSVWAGSFVSDATQVKVAQESSTFTTPGNNVVSVTVTGANLVITVNWAASGSAGTYNYWIEYL